MSIILVKYVIYEFGAFRYLQIKLKCTDKGNIGTMNRSFVYTRKQKKNKERLYRTTLIREHIHDP